MLTLESRKTTGNCLPASQCSTRVIVGGNRLSCCSRVGRDLVVVDHVCCVVFEEGYT